jgi:hypothetical protein
MHEHNVCEHEIKYCKVCDVVYCEKCKKQWYSYNITYNQYSTTWIGDGTYPGITTINSHVHGKDLE